MSEGRPTDNAPQQAGIPQADQTPPPENPHLDENPHPDEKPHYWAWTDRWDPGKWETPENPTPLQRVLAGIALVIVLVMTVYVPLRILNIL